MFMELLKPVLRKIHNVTIEEIRSNVQKEKRIIDTLEPVMNQHRLVVDPKVIEKDYNTVKDYPVESQVRYMLFHQMTRITKDRGALIHDDRLDALQMAVQYWVDFMAADAEMEIQSRKEELFDIEIENFINGVLDKKNIDSTPVWMN